MRIQLSTLLLVTALIALSLGWMVDRKKWQAKHAELSSSNRERDGQLFAGFFTCAKTYRTLNIFFNLSELEDQGGLEWFPDRSEFVQTQIVSDVLEVYRNRKELELCSRTGALGNFDAIVISRDALKQMDCKTTDQFFQIATSLEKFGVPSHYPELYDTKSVEHKSLRKFISSAIAIVDRFYPR